MAVEKKKPNRRRNRAVTVRMTDEEYAAFRQKVRKAGISQQDYTVSAVLGAAVRPAEEIAVLKGISATFADFVRQLRGMAANLNQLARIANSTGMAPPASLISQFSAQVAEFRERGEMIWQSIRSSIGGQRAGQA